jgi:hypothetical protein
VISVEAVVKSARIQFLVSILAISSVMAAPSNPEARSMAADAGPSMQVHRKVRNMIFPAVRGGTFRLIASPRKPLLLAFIQVLPDSAATPSRSEAPYLESMERQYAARGLRVAAIDASSKVSPPSARHGELVNASYDWHLTFPLLEDTNGRAAREFHVRTLPTIVLIDDTGFIVQSWEGYAPPALLAQGIERLLGGPLGTIPEITTN